MTIKTASHTQATDPQNTHSRRVQQLIETSTLIVLGVVLFLIGMFPLRVNQDVALFIETGISILDGQIPYVDFVEINPPLIYYVNAIPVSIANIIAINPIPILLLLVWFAVLYSVTATFYIGRQVPVQHATQVSSLALGLSLLTLLLVGSNDYAQREHVFIICLLPALLVRWMRSQQWEVNRWMAITAGLFVSIGVFIKPQFLIVILAVELYWLISARTLRNFMTPEVYAFTAFGLLYLIHFALVPREMTRALFQDVLPQVLIGYYAFDSIGLGLLPIVPLVLLAVAPFLPRRRNPEIICLERSLSIVIIAGVLFYLMQRKGWIYHTAPAVAGAIFLIMILSSRWIESRFKGKPASIPLGKARSPKWRQPLFSALIVLFLLLTWARVAETSYLDNQSLREIISENSDEGDKLAWVSTSILPESQIRVQMDRQQASRYITANYPIVFAYKAVQDAVEIYRNPETLPSPVSLYLVALAEDIEKYEPPLVLISSENPCYHCPKNLQLDVFLDRMGFMDSAIMSDYQRIGEVEDWVVYRRHTTITDTMN